MKVVIKEDMISPNTPGKTWKAGTNVYGRIGVDLVKDGNALEVPEQKGEEWMLGGKPSDKMKILRKPNDVTLDELKKHHPEYKKK